MSRTISRLAFVSSLLVLMAASSSAMAHSRDYLFDSGNHYVRIEGNRVIIKGDAATPAVIGKTGMLHIGERLVGVSARDKKYLADYYAIVFDIREQAKRVAGKAESDAWRAVGVILGDVFSGAGGAGNEEAAQKSLRQSVRADVAPLCEKVAQLKRLQDKVALDVSAFKPYTVVTQSDITNCER